MVVEFQDVHPGMCNFVNGQLMLQSCIHDNCIIHEEAMASVTRMHKLVFSLADMSSDSGLGRCPVCFDELVNDENGPVISTQCLHLYHRKCFETLCQDFLEKNQTRLHKKHCIRRFNCAVCRGETCLSHYFLISPNFVNSVNVRAKLLCSNKKRKSSPDADILPILKTPRLTRTDTPITEHPLLSGSDIVNLITSPIRTPTLRPPTNIPPAPRGNRTRPRIPFDCLRIDTSLCNNI